MSKRYLDTDVYTAARARVREVIRAFPRFTVSFSGGKDSGVLLNLVLDVAREEGRLPVPVLTIDLEAQYAKTVDFVGRMLERPDVAPTWVCLPLHLRNAVSQHQPHWLCWDPDREAAWVRPLPAAPGVVADEATYPFFRRGMEFEEFVPAYGEWFSAGEQTACFVGIRSDESLNRYRTISSTTKARWRGHGWTTWTTPHVLNVYPIYDWRTEDLWTATGRQGWDYNRIYDLMHLAGLSVHQMRLCQPYGDDQRRGLYLFKILEPETWARVVARVEGANFGNRYVGTRALEAGRMALPPGHTYRSYSHFLLDSMPPHVAAHYRQKIARFLWWWRKHGGWPVPDAADPKLEAARKTPSWRRICKVLLRNDYWCKGLTFGQTKREMERQLALVARYLDSGEGA